MTITNTCSILGKYFNAYRREIRGREWMLDRIPLNKTCECLNDCARVTFQTVLINHHLLADWWDSLQQCGFYISRSELPHWLALCLCPLSFLSCVPCRLKSQWVGPQRPVFHPDHPPAHWFWVFLSWVSSHEICFKSASGFLQFRSVHLGKSVPFRWGSYWDYLVSVVWKGR